MTKKGIGVKPHKAHRKPCPICKRHHSENAHRFHGPKSYKRTHGKKA